MRTPATTPTGKKIPRSNHTPGRRGGGRSGSPAGRGADATGAVAPVVTILSVVRGPGRAC